jgi:hypothetical protein
MINKKRFRVLQRRTVLRGAAAGGVALIGLPTLEAMLNTSGTAFAQGAPLPRRFGVWFWGNGVQKDTWAPATTGANWTVPDDWQLAPLLLRKLKDRVTVVTGMQIPGGDRAQQPHVWAQCPLLSGSDFFEASGVPARMVSGTVEHVVAGKIGAAPAIVAAVNARPSANATTVEPNLSWVAVPGQPAGAASANPARSSRLPADLFREIFGAGPMSGTGAADSGRDRALASVLDAVRSQIRALQPRVSANDRARLEAHFTAVRSVEAQLQTDAGRAASCTSASQMAIPATANPNDASDAGMRSRNDAFSRIIALALACSARSSFSLQFAGAGDQAAMPVQVNFKGRGFHSLNHVAFGKPQSADYPPAQKDVQAGVRYQIDRLADFLELLAQTPDVGGTSLLDSCAILATTELFDGNVHSYVQHPLVIAGSARGRLKTGLHLKESGSPCKLVLSLMRAVLGPQVAEFGTKQYRVTEGLAAIEGTGI